MFLWNGELFHNISVTWSPFYIVTMLIWKFSLQTSLWMNIVFLLQLCQEAIVHSLNEVLSMFAAIWINFAVWPLHYTQHDPEQKERTSCCWLDSTIPFLHMLYVVLGYWLVRCSYHSLVSFNKTVFLVLQVWQHSLFVYLCGIHPDA